MKKLKAIWNIYRCSYFHLVTVEESIISINKKPQKTVIFDSNMNQEVFDNTMKDFADALAKQIEDSKSIHEL